jgi:hypothetical protein
MACSVAAGFGLQLTGVQLGFHGGVQLGCNVILSYFAVLAASPGGCSREPAGKMLPGLPDEEGSPPARRAARSTGPLSWAFTGRQSALPRNLRGTPP